MRSSLVRSIKPIPISTIPTALLRLPPKQLSTPDSITSAGLKPESPTIDRILKSFASKRFTRSAKLAGDGRGLGASIPIEIKSDSESIDQSQDEQLADLLPPNLRIEKFMTRRKEYQGVKTSHRELVHSFHPFFFLLSFPLPPSTITLSILSDEGALTDVSFTWS
jgi:hypothetical protein